MTKTNSLYDKMERNLEWKKKSNSINAEIEPILARIKSAGKALHVRETKCSAAAKSLYEDCVANIDKFMTEKYPSIVKVINELNKAHIKIENSVEFCRFEYHDILAATDDSRVKDAKLYIESKGDLYHARSMSISYVMTKQGISVFIGTGNDRPTECFKIGLRGLVQKCYNSSIIKNTICTRPATEPTIESVLPYLFLIDHFKDRAYDDFLDTVDTTLSEFETDKE